MATDSNAKTPLLRHHFLWTGSKKSGDFMVLIGPDALELTDDDKTLAPDPARPGQVMFVEGEANFRAHISPFVTVRPDEYAVIHNPAANPSFPDYPNGSWRSKRQEVPDLAMGKKRIVTRGSFPLWPGQWSEVRRVPTIQSHQFLLVVVEDPDGIDKEAPYYPLLLKCAGITTAFVDEGSPKQSAGNQAAADEQGADEKVSAPEATVVVKSAEKAEPKFRRGQRIIVPGKWTESFVPPTGTDVIPVEGGAKGEVLRQALVLGPIEFCRLYDENGQPRNTGGPGRVFPGPYDKVENRSSRNGVYDKYHITLDSGLLLRVIALNISKDDLRSQLPPNVTLSEADGKKENFAQGDEIFIGGVDAYFMPTMDLVVIDPVTREPHVGNDHSSVFVRAIAVDQKSGIYVEDKETGEIELKRGGRKYLLDPRLSRHVVRRVPGRIWNLLIAFGEPHKQTDQKFVETPWALSVVVPNNMAALIIGKGERRAVIGPKYDLLQFDELPEVLELSKGCPKTDKGMVETCFLRVDGNRVSDEIAVTSGDLVRFRIRVSYGVRFIGTSADEQAKWFNHQNYVQLLADHLRSVLSAAAQLLTGLEIYRDVAGFVRNTILGGKPSEGHRPGTLFEENGMLVNEVEVLAMNVEDAEVRQSLETAHRKMASLSVDDVAAKAELASLRHRDEVEKQRLLLDIARLQRTQDMALQKVQLESRTTVEVAKLTEAAQKSKLQFEQEISRLRQAAQAELDLAKEKYDAGVAEVTRGMDKADEDQRLALAKVRDDALLELERSRSETQARLLESYTKTVVDQLKAVQPELIAALEGMGNKQVLADLAAHLPAATGELGFLLGQGGIAGVKRLVEGTALGNVFTQLGQSTQAAQNGAAISATE